jgi:hypothetical protein
MLRIAFTALEEVSIEGEEDLVEVIYAIPKAIM